jgi:hypothetical protein
MVFFVLNAPVGQYTLVVSAMGYKTVKQRVTVEKGVAATVNLVIPEEALMLEELTVTASSVERVKKTPFNAVAVDAKEWANSTKNLSDALKKLPGVKLRESGQLIAHSSSLIRVPSKFFTKPCFCINPAGKSKVPSWKIFISQLENYFFSVGKSKFRSRAILGEFLGLFLNYFKRFLFILTPMSGLWTKVKMFDIE